MTVASEPIQSITASESAERCARALRAHPAVADACAEPDGTRLRAWFVPDRGRGRVPASGACTLVDENGVEFRGALVDVSYDGVRVRCADAPPEVGAVVQMVIESEVLGGIDGRLGRVRWRRGHETGVAFEGNFDDAHGLVRFVQAFIDAACGASSESPALSPQLRARCEVACTVDLGSAGACAGRTVDLSASGLQVELALVPTVDWRDQKLVVQLAIPGAPPLRGSVVRQAGNRLALSLAPDDVAARFLTELVAASVRDTAVARTTLLAWLRAQGVNTPVSLHAVESIPRDAQGMVDARALPRT